MEPQQYDVKRWGTLECDSRVEILFLSTVWDARKRYMPDPCCH